MKTYTAMTRAFIVQRTDTDCLIVSWARYVSGIEKDLDDAYWTGEETEIETLLNRLRNAKRNDEQDGGDQYILF